MPELAEPAAVVEQFDCPTCEVPAGSTCRTRGGKVAPKYHTPRFTLVPQLRAELEVRTPADRGPRPRVGEGPGGRGRRSGGRDKAHESGVRPLQHSPAGAPEPA